MLKHNNLVSRLIGFALISVFLTNCTLPGAESDDQEKIQEEVVNTLAEAPFDELTPQEFFSMCEEAGGQVEQWGSSWACDFKDDEDITCNWAGECNFGTVPEIVTAGYTLEQPEIAEENDPGKFVDRCREAGGVFFEWHAGFGCDFDEDMDVICAPEDGGCGTGLVTEMTDALPTEDVVSNPQENSPDVVLVAQLFEPAFQPDAVVFVDLGSSDGQDEFVLAKQVIPEDFFSPPAANSDNAVAIETAPEDEEEPSAGEMCDDKTDTPFECRSKVYELYGNVCETLGGKPTYWDQSEDEYYVTCDAKGDETDTKCDRHGCEEYETPRLDFGGFEDALQATQVYILLAGPTDAEQVFLNSLNLSDALYTAYIGMNGIMRELEGQNGIFAPTNLPGTVSIIAPNNLFEPPIDPGVLVLSANIGGDPLQEKICTHVIPPICLPTGGLLIPTEKLVYFVSATDLPMPDTFKWVEGSRDISDGTSNTVLKEENPTTIATPGTIVKVTVTQGNVPLPTSTPKPPTKKPPIKKPPTKKPPTNTPLPPSLTPIPPTQPPTITPTPVPADPMNAQISGIVWNDADGNGSKNGGENNIGVQTVKLGAGACNSTGLDTANTGLSGSYAFTGLAAGTYCVSVTRTGSCGDIASPTTATKFTVNLSPGQTVTKNFGFQKIIC